MFVFSQGSRTVPPPHHKSPYLRIVLLALVAHLLVFALTPPFEFAPYAYYEEKQDTIRVEEVIDYKTPLKPEENPMPPVEIDPIDAEVEEEYIIPPTIYGDAGKIPLQTERSEEKPGQFYAVDEPPVLIYFEKPVYPAFSRESGIEGTVAVKVVVGRDGKVIEAVILGSDVTSEMEQAALDAARGCLFKPGKQRGKPVPVAVKVPFEFRLSECR
jgi:TonB family protein